MFIFVNSWRMSRASGSDRASRSSFVTTNVSSARQAARANRSPGRSQFALVAMIDASDHHERRAREVRLAVR